MRTIYSLLIGFLAAFTAGCSGDTVGNGDAGAGKTDASATLDGAPGSGIECDKGEYSGSFAVREYEDLKELAGHTSVAGDIKIDEGNFGIVDLQPLRCLRSVGGDLLVGYLTLDVVHSNPNLLSLRGLENLVSVGGTLEIRHGDRLEDLKQLGSLEVVGGSLIIAENESLASLDGLGSVGSVGNDLIVSGNDNLEDFDGVTNLRRINGSLEIRYNRVMGNLSGIGSLESVGGDIRIKENHSLPTCVVDQFKNELQNRGFSGDVEVCGNYDDECGAEECKYYYCSDGTSMTSLTLETARDLESLSPCEKIRGTLGINSDLENIDGLANLREVESLSIWNNEHLSNVDGLSNLESILFSVVILNNESLVSLRGLSGLTGSLDNLYVRGNDSLPTCEARWLADRLDVPGGGITICENLEDECGSAPCE